MLNVQLLIRQSRNKANLHKEQRPMSPQALLTIIGTDQIFNMRVIGYIQNFHFATRIFD